MNMNLVISSDEKHFEQAATVIASIVRRAKRPIVVLYYLRGAPLPAPIRTRLLEVEFRAPTKNYTGNLPNHVSSAAFDRLSVIEDKPEWERCFLLDTDQLALKDVSSIYDVLFEGQLVAARTGGTNAQISEWWFHQAWPDGAPDPDQPCPWFSAVLNLTELRKIQAIKKFEAYLEKFHLGEQMTFSMVVSGRVKPMPQESNWLVWEIERLGNSARTALECGIIQPYLLHWSAPRKPWNTKGIFGGQFWNRESVTWDELEQEITNREADQGKMPAIIIYLSRCGIRSPNLVDDLDSNGFDIRGLRGCDASEPFAFPETGDFSLQLFGRYPTRSELACWMSHRWALEMFLEQTEHPFAMICEDDAIFRGTASEIDACCGQLGDDPWILYAYSSSPAHAGPKDNDRTVVVPIDGIGLVGTVGYCVNRAAARRLLAIDLANPLGPVDELLRRATIPKFATKHDFISIVKCSSLIRPINVSDSGRQTTPGTESPVNGKLLIGICSCHGHEDQRTAIRETWFPKNLNNVQARFFVGGGKISEPDTIQLDAPDDYSHLPLKVRRFFQKALVDFDFDWLFKCDDDTFLVPERLQSLMGTHDLVGSMSLAECPAASGGAGYLMSRKMVELLASADHLNPTGSEDKILTGFLTRTGVTWRATNRLRMDAKRIPRKDNDLISCHWISPERMASQHAILSNEISEEILAHHRHWSDTVFLYASGTFIRKSTDDAGLWSRIGHNIVELAWFDWAPERFELDDQGRAHQVADDQNAS